MSWRDECWFCEYLTDDNECEYNCHPNDCEFILENRVEAEKDEKSLDELD